MRHKDMKGNRKGTAKRGQKEVMTHTSQQTNAFLVFVHILAAAAVKKDVHDKARPQRRMSTLQAGLDTDQALGVFFSLFFAARTVSSNPADDCPWCISCDFGNFNHPTKWRRGGVRESNVRSRLGDKVVYLLQGGGAPPGSPCYRGYPPVPRQNQILVRFRRCRPTWRWNTPWQYICEETTGLSFSSMGHW